MNAASKRAQRPELARGLCRARAVSPEARVKCARTPAILLSTLSSLVFHVACVAALPLCAANGGYVSLKSTNYLSKKHEYICLKTHNISVLHDDPYYLF